MRKKQRVKRRRAAKKPQASPCYTAKPEAIQAMRYGREPFNDLRLWLGRLPTVQSVGVTVPTLPLGDPTKEPKPKLFIQLKGNSATALVVDPGDYILCGPDGRVEVWDAESFEDAYKHPGRN
jgi:hypothetical protein